MEPKNKPKHPEILYKYRSWEPSYNQETLIKSQVYFASIDQFNDPFDCRIPFRYRESDLTQEKLFHKYIELAKLLHSEWSDAKLHELAFEFQRRDLIHDEKHIEEVNEQLKSQFQAEFGILSLSAIKDNFLMWGHYAKSHTGFCIGYNTQALYESIGGQLGPIIYSEDFPEFGLFEDLIHHGIKGSYWKSQVWEYEVEYRMIKSYIAKKTIKIPPEITKEIILGSNMKQSTKFEILELANKVYPNARVYDVKLHNKKFKLLLDQIR